MHRALVDGQVQRLLVAHIAGREVAVLKVRIPPPSPSLATGVAEPGGVMPGNDSPRATPGETVHVVLVAGRGLGTLNAA
ncbi:MAG: hypothetical protein M3O50_18970 [Myxococcota bacterium]|nr:hypothetical protein [Myxococcota bacterium]